VFINAVDGIGNCRSGRLYINSAYILAYLIINFKTKSARVPRRGVLGDFGIFGGTVKGEIRDILYQLQHCSEII